MRRLVHQALHDEFPDGEPDDALAPDPARKPPVEGWTPRQLDQGWSAVLEGERVVDLPESDQLRGTPIAVVAGAIWARESFTITGIIGRDSSAGRRVGSHLPGQLKGDHALRYVISYDLLAHRIRHGIRHTAALAGRRPRPPVANDRLRHMLIGDARVSKADGSQSLDLQRDALQAAGVDARHVYHDCASGVRYDRPGLDSCLRALRTGDVVVAWKLDRLGRTLAHLVNTVQDLSARGVGLRVLTGHGAQIDTTMAAGRLVFGIFARWPRSPGTRRQSFPNYFQPACPVLSCYTLVS